MNQEDPTEAAIAAVSSAPRVTLADLEANIVSEHVFTAEQAALATGAINIGDAYPEDVFGVGKPLSLLTICVLTLRNGFTVLGQSACASPENFNADMGRQIARKDAVEKIWPLMGYQLKEQLFQLAHGPSDSYPFDKDRPGANIHGIGPDTDGGPNPHFKGQP